MDALLSALITHLFEEPRNAALTISLVGNVALAWAHVVWRREEKLERDKTIETFAKITDVLNNLRNAFSAQTGKSV